MSDLATPISFESLVAALLPVECRKIAPCKGPCCRPETHAVGFWRQLQDGQACCACCAGARLRAQHVWRNACGDTARCRPCCCFRCGCLLPHHIFSISYMHTATLTDRPFRNQQVAAVSHKNWWVWGSCAWFEGNTAAAADDVMAGTDGEEQRTLSSSSVVERIVHGETALDVLSRSQHSVRSHLPPACWQGFLVGCSHGAQQDDESVHVLLRRVATCCRPCVQQLRELSQRGACRALHVRPCFKASSASCTPIHTSACEAGPLSGVGFAWPLLCCAVCAQYRFC